MKTSKTSTLQEAERFGSLVEWRLLNPEDLEAVQTDAEARDIEVETILRHELGLPRRRLVEALAEYYQCPWIEYDSRVPVPPELLEGLDASRLCEGLWFPVTKTEDRVVIATCDPHDPFTAEEVKAFFGCEACEFRVALAQDIFAYIQDYLHAPPEHLIGNERTALAFWRNTLARWRTRLSCYRTDFAKARTHLSLLRGGLALITIGRTMLRIRPVAPLIPLYWAIITAGFVAVVLGLLTYVKLKKSILSPPRHQTLIEVTSATMYFLENYQFVGNPPEDSSPKKTMLARLAELLPHSCVFIDPSHDNKVRSYLAHERTSLAAQRTVLACYRTIYARARTGLSFIRTGVAFASIGLGLIEYFGLSLLTFLDSFLILAGVLMVVDGAVWYWPIRKEQCEASKCAVVC